MQRRGLVIGVVLALFVTTVAAQQGIAPSAAIPGWVLPASTSAVNSAGQLPDATSLRWSDIFLRRSAAKTLTIDTDGANGALTLVTMFGPLTASGTITTTSGSFAWNGDTFLSRDAANITAQVNSTNAQVSRIYNTFTDASNYERGLVGWAGNQFVVGTQNAGTGSARVLRFQTSSTNQWELGTAGNLADLGTHTITAGSSIISPSFTSTGGGLNVANVGANSCGTTSATIAGNNNAFQITVGAGSGTQCRVAFSSAAPTEWDCTSNDSTTTIAVRTTPVDTTHTDFIGAFVAADKVTGVCFAR